MFDVGSFCIYLCAFVIHEVVENKAQCFHVGNELIIDLVNRVQIGAFLGIITYVEISMQVWNEPVNMRFAKGVLKRFTLTLF